MKFWVKYFVKKMLMRKSCWKKIKNIGIKWWNCEREISNIEEKIKLREICVGKFLEIKIIFIKNKLKKILKKISSRWMVSF